MLPRYARRNVGRCRRADRTSRRRSIETRNRQLEACAQPARIMIDEPHLASVLAGDRPRHAQAQADTARVGIARRLEPIEWREHLLLLVKRDARTIVVDGHTEAA